MHILKKTENLQMSQNHKDNVTISYNRRSQWPRRLRRGSRTARLLGLRVRIAPEAWMSVLCVLYVVRKRSLRPSDLSSRGVLGPLGLSSHEKKKLHLYSAQLQALTALPVSLPFGLLRFVVWYIRYPRFQGKSIILLQGRRERWSWGQHLFICS